MTFMVERLAQLRRYLEHLRAIRPRVTDGTTLRADLTLHNDVLFSLLTVCQLVIDISGELAARRGEPFEDYTSGVRLLAGLPGFRPELVDALARLPGFRNVLVHEYAELDYGRVIEALADLGPVEEFVKLVASLDGI